tara:strand:+ start:188 stop:538 length:351 start_codon:yes stop_codon:yes gene_type:complete
MNGSTYKTTRFISTAISLVGWVIIVFSILCILVSLLSRQLEYGLLTIPFSLGFAILGLLLVIQGQLTRATVDNADSNAEILAIMKSTYVKDMSGKGVEIKDHGRAKKTEIDKEILP